MIEDSKAHPPHDLSLLGSRLRFAVLVTGAVLVGEVVGGILANSLALLSDAGHVFTDILALSLSWFGVMQAARPATPRMTFGYHRIGILIAIFNALTLMGVALFIFYEAYQRLKDPEPVRGVLMFSVAFVGLLANGLVVMKLRTYQKGSLNVRSAFLHAAGDTLASLGVIAGGLIIFFTGWFWVDPAVSVFIALIIAIAAWGIVKEGVSIFLEASPRHLDLEEMVKAIKAVPGVKDVHDLHVWSIAPRLHALSCHVLIDDLSISEGASIRERLSELLRRRFEIGHSTMQFECVSCSPNALYCLLLPGGEERMGEEKGKGVAG